MAHDESSPSTVALFLAQCRESFAFLSEFHFAEAPIPKLPTTNPVQCRFFNGKLLVIVEGINWGRNADCYFEDTTGLKAHLFLFVPKDKRAPQLQRNPDEPGQCFQIRVAAQQVRDHCADLLQGDVTRFLDRAAYWKRVSGRDRSYQKHVLP